MQSTDVAALYGILEQDTNRLLSPSLTLVQSKQEAGHKSNVERKGPAFRLLGLISPNFETCYEKTESLVAFKPRLVGLIVTGAIFPKSSAEAECEALRKAVQTSVDACEIEEAASIEDRRAKLVELEEMADDPKYANYKGDQWRAAGGSLGIAFPDPFKAFGGSTSQGPRRADGWVLSVKNVVKLRRAELKKEEEDDGAAEAAKAAHSAAALAVYKAAHEAAAKFEKVQLEKARDAGGSTLRDRLWARAVAKADYNSERGVRGGLAQPLAAKEKGRAKTNRLRRKNRWKHTKYDTSRYAEKNNYADYCEKGREPAGCYDPVDDLELCTGL